MRETILRDFFLGNVTGSALAQDVAGSKKQIGPINWIVQIEDMEGELEVTRPMLVALCDAVLAQQFPTEQLSTVGFALIASDKFTWDGEDVVGGVIHDWSCPEVNYPLTLDNVTRFKNWLLELEPYPPKPPLQATPKNGSLISRTEKRRLL
jgi:hypothetical protein